jgi:hypothetical protein
MQSVEIRIAVNPKDDGLAIDHEMPLPVLQGGLDNPRTALAPVASTLRDQTDTVAIALHPKAVAVVLDLVKLVRGIGDSAGFGGDAELECAGHGPGVVCSASGSLRM